MTVENFDKYMELAKVVNHTWGTGSQFHALTDRTVRFNILDDKKVKGAVTMLVNFPNDHKLVRDQSEKHREDCMETMKGAIKALAEKYEEETGKKIKLSLDKDSCQHNVEFLSNAQYRPVLPAVFRLNCLITVD